MTEKLRSIKKGIAGVAASAAILPGVVACGDGTHAEPVVPPRGCIRVDLLAGEEAFLLDGIDVLHIFNGRPISGVVVFDSKSNFEETIPLITREEEAVELQHGIPVVITFKPNDHILAEVDCPRP